MQSQGARQSLASRITSNRLVALKAPLGEIMRMRQSVVMNKYYYLLMLVIKRENKTHESLHEQRLRYFFLAPLQ
jgi:hypothetical protein